MSSAFQVSGVITNSVIEGCDISLIPSPVSDVIGLESLGLSIDHSCIVDSDLVVSSSDTYTGVCPIEFTRVYTVADECGNSIQATQTFTLGNTPPVTYGGTETVSEGDSVTVVIDIPEDEEDDSSTLVITISNLDTQGGTFTINGVVVTDGATFSAADLANIVYEAPSDVSTNTVAVSYTHLTLPTTSRV